MGKPANVCDIIQDLNLVKVFPPLKSSHKNSNMVIATNKKSTRNECSVLLTQGKKKKKIV